MTSHYFTLTATRLMCPALQLCCLRHMPEISGIMPVGCVHAWR